MPGGPGFRERFKKTFGVDIDAYAPGFYAATFAVAQAMQAAGSDEPAKFIPSMKSVKMNTLLGPVQFDATGEWIKPPVTIYEISGGKLVVLPKSR